jgi:hypothetical protein
MNITKIKNVFLIVGLSSLIGVLGWNALTSTKNYDDYPVGPWQNSEFIGQDSAEVGELVRFLADGEIVRWDCLPKTSDCESYGEFGENFVISFRTPGLYTIIASIYTDGALTIHTQDVQVGPKDIEVIVDPILPENVLVFDMDLVKKVKGWASKYNVDTKTCDSLSSNFMTVVKMVEDGHLVTPHQIIQKTVDLNSNLTLNKSLMSDLQLYLTSQSDVGNLLTPEQHIVVWRSIAAGFDNAK